MSPASNTEAESSNRRREFISGLAGKRIGDEICDFSGRQLVAEGKACREPLTAANSLGWTWRSDSELLIGIDELQGVKVFSSAAAGENRALASNRADQLMFGQDALVSVRDCIRYAAGGLRRPR